MPWAIEIRDPDGDRYIAEWSKSDTKNSAWARFYSGRALIHPNATFECVKVIAALKSAGE